MKKICIILAAMLLCLAVTACAEPAENAEAPSLIGVTEGDTYENAMFGIGCKLEGWTYSTAEEIAQINQVAEELLGEKAAEMLKQGASLITMLAKSPNALQNVNFQASDASQLKDLFETYGFAAVIGSSTSVYKQQLEEAGCITSSSGWSKGITWPASPSPPPCRTARTTSSAASTCCRRMNCN